MEDRLPFIAAIISGVITAAATAFYIEEYLPLMILVIVGSIFILRFNAWALVGGFLIGLAVLEYEADSERFKIILALLLIGSVFQVITALLVGVRSQSILERSSYWQNVVFAGIGVTAVVCAYLLAWGDAAPPEWSLSREEKLLYLGFNVMTFAMEPTAKLTLGGDGKLSITDINPALTTLQETGQYSPEIIIGLLNMFGAFLLRTILVAPPTWAAFFAAFRQIGFRFWEVGNLLRQTWRGYWGGSWIMIPGLIFTVPLFIAQAAVAATNPNLSVYLLVAALAVGYFVFSLGAGMGVRKGL